MSEIKLKPCPFCGGEAREAYRGVNNSRMFECTNRSCGVVMNFVSRKGELTAREKYNRRVAEIKADKEQEERKERLIDANALIEGRVENDPVRIAAMAAPTAFDKEKVIEELENKQSEALKMRGDRNTSCTTELKSFWSGRLEAYALAAMIVEKGGIE